MYNKYTAICVDYEQRSFLMLCFFGKSVIEVQEAAWRWAEAEFSGDFEVLSVLEGFANDLSGRNTIPVLMAEDILKTLTKHKQSDNLSKQ